MQCKELQFRVFLLHCWDFTDETIAMQINDIHFAGRVEEIRWQWPVEHVVAEIQVLHGFGPVRDQIFIEGTGETIVFQVQELEIGHHAVEFVDVAVKPVVVQAQFDEVWQRLEWDGSGHEIVGQSETGELRQIFKRIRQTAAERAIGDVQNFQAAHLGEAGRNWPLEVAVPLQDEGVDVVQVTDLVGDRTREIVLWQTKPRNSTTIEARKDSQPHDLQTGGKELLIPVAD
mmetsp:Transcript_5094/g.14898  ORF Transcript_5094/g.14898 Transcript_5094/m.14898 type:complete len:230 (-) Transcript_5094:1179-1868(-)